MKISLHTKTRMLRPYNCCSKQFSTNSFKEIQCRWLTNTVLTSRLKRRCPGLQWPPCSLSKQNTQDGTYVLQPPGSRNKRASSPFRSNATSLLSCSVVLWWWAVSCVLFSALLPPTVSGDIAVTPASLSACLESAMTSPSVDLTHSSYWLSPFQWSETFSCFSPTLPEYQSSISLSDMHAGLQFHHTVFIPFMQDEIMSTLCKQVKCWFQDYLCN